MWVTDKCSRVTTDLEPVGGRVAAAHDTNSTDVTSKEVIKDVRGVRPPLGELFFILGHNMN